MFRNYIKVALRYLTRNKGYTFINVLGLAIGITCCILIMLFVKSEWSYDRFHSKSSQLHRVWLQEIYSKDQVFTNTTTPIPMGAALKANIPDVETYCRVFAFNTLVEYEGRRFNEPLNMVDSNFFDVFDFGIEEGPASNVFPNPNSIVLTKPLARKYFGKEYAIGKNLELQLGNQKVLFTVTAIAKETPQESNIQYTMLIPHSNDRYLFSERVRTTGWTNVAPETYVVLKPGATAEGAEAKFDPMVKQLAGENYKPGQYNIHLQPITDIHLNNNLPAGNLPISDPAYSYILGTIGILILLIACINFVTLSVGRSATRAMEVGVRKVLGAERKQLIRQFWGEALLLTITSFIIAIALSFALLKPFNQIADRQLELEFNPFTILFLVGLILVVGLIAGIYPAIVLSGFNPMKVLKGTLQTGTGMGLFRKSLIAGQFMASILMIIGTIAVGKQLRFLQNKNLGYDKERIVVVPTNKSIAQGRPLAALYRAELAKEPSVISSTGSIFSFTESGWFNMNYTDDNDVFRGFMMNAVDADFISTMKLQLIRGRDFSKDNPADSNASMIINEALAKEYGWTDPIGKKLPGRYPFEVIGVLKDFNVQSLHNPITPLVVVLKPDSIFRGSSDISNNFPAQPRITIRLKPGDLQEQVATLKAAWKKVAGEQDFEYRFLDESLNSLYLAENRLSTIVSYASILSIFIACMGLFGLATLVVARRTKEIGIRKVLGANVGSLVALLSKDFLILVTIAALVAFPLAWWALNKWLQDFAYRINVKWWIFLVAALAALLVALLTVSVQAVKAALMNPVKSLRTE